MPTNHVLRLNRIEIGPEVGKDNMNNDFTPAVIKALRDSLKLTQSNFARKLKIDVITVSRWERGTQRPTVVAIRKLQRLQRKNNNG